MRLGSAGVSYCKPATRGFISYPHFKTNCRAVFAIDTWDRPSVQNVQIKWEGTVTSSSSQFCHTTAPTSLSIYIYIYIYIISPLLYNQSILDYKYMYVDSRKWQYKTWLEEQYSSEYSQNTTTSKLIMVIWLANQVVCSVLVFPGLVQYVGWT